MFGGFGGFGGAGVGSALIRIGADFTGLRSQTRAAVMGMRTELQAATRGMNVAPGRSPLTNLNKDLDTAVKKAGLLQKALKAAVLGIGLGGVMGAGQAINAAIQFESAFAGVEKTVEATTEELAGLREEFLQMAREMPVAATTLANIGESAGALGVAVPDIRKFTEVVATIGSTTNVSTEEAATALGQLSNVLNLTSDDYERFASTLVDLGNKGASTEKQILEITRRFGAAAKLFGLSAADTLAIGSSAANLGMQPELASSALTRLTMRLNNISSSQNSVADNADKAGISMEKFIEISLAGGDAAQKLGEATGNSAKELKALATSSESLDVLQRAMGVTGKEFDRIKKNDPSQIFEMLFAGMKSMPETEIQTFITRLLGPTATAGGGVGLQQLMLGLSDSVEKNLIPQLAAGSKSWEENTAAVAEAEKRYKSTASQFSLMKNLITDVMIRVGSTFLPSVVAVLSVITEQIPAVFAAIGDVYKRTLEGPFTALLTAAGQLGEQLGRILFEWGEGGAGDNVTGVFQLFADILGIVAEQLASVLDVLTAITANPVMQGLGKMVVLLGAAALAFKGFTALKGMVGGLGNSLLRMMTFGRMGGAAAPVDPAAAQQQVAAKSQIAAAEMQLRAASLSMVDASDFAAIRKGEQGVYRPVPLTPEQSYAIRAQRNPDLMPGMSPRVVPHYNPDIITPAPPRIGGLSEAGFMVTSTTEKVGRDLVKRSVAGIQGGMEKAAATVKSIGSRAVSMLSSGLSLVGKAFWPLFIADLVGNLVAAPIGDFIRGSTGFKRLADEWSKGWVDGLAATFQTISEGDDTFVGRPDSYKLGTRDIAKETLKGLAGEVPGAERTAIGAIMDKVEAAAGDDFAWLEALSEMGDWVRERSEDLRERPTTPLVTDAELNAMRRYLTPEGGGAANQMLVTADAIKKERDAILASGTQTNEYWVALNDLMAVLPGGEDAVMPAAGGPEWNALTAQGRADVFTEWAEKAKAVVANANSLMLSSGVNLLNVQDLINQAKEAAIAIPSELEPEGGLFPQNLTDAPVKAAIQTLLDRYTAWLQSMAEGANAAFRTAIIDAAKEAGVNLPGYRLAQLTPDKLKQAAGLFTTPLPQGAGFLREQALDRIGDLGTKPYVQPGATARDASGLVQLRADLDGLREWSRTQQEALGPYFTEASLWLHQFSDVVEGADSGSNRERADVISKVLGIDRDKLNPKNEKRIDRLWTQVMDRFAIASGLVGRDQLATIANNTQAGLTNALLSGSKIDQTTWTQLTSLMFDGIGDRTEDVSNRLGNAVTSWFIKSGNKVDWDKIRKAYNKGKDPKDQITEAMIGKGKDAKPDPRLVALYEQQQVDAFNKSFENVEGFIKAKNYGDLKNAVLAGLVDDFEAVDSAEDKEAILTTLRDALPGEFNTWDKVVDELLPATEGEGPVAVWQQRFTDMASKASQPAFDYGMTLGNRAYTGFDTGVTATIAAFGTPTVDLGAAYARGRAAAQEFARGLASLTPSYETPYTPPPGFDGPGFNRGGGGGGGGTTSTSDDGGTGGGNGRAGADGGDGGRGADGGRGGRGGDGGTAGRAFRSAGQQVSQGFQRVMQGVSAPAPRMALSPSMGSSPGAPAGPQGGMQVSRNQSIYVQRMELFEQASETSVLRTLQFMDPASGGG